MGEGDGEIAKGREGAEVGEDETEVLDRAGEVGCQGGEKVDVGEGGGIEPGLVRREGGAESSDGGVELELKRRSLGRREYR